MRPVHRRDNPTSGDFVDYRDAYPYLHSRLGTYCSYCERCIHTSLAVEHIQPKGLLQYAGLSGRWENFLLACVNCNSTKGDKDVMLDLLYFPDRDNTFVALEYTADGRIIPATHLNAVQKQIATRTLELTGLEKQVRQTLDENGNLVAMDRISQRMEVWAEAEEALSDLLSNPSDTVRGLIVKNVRAHGFFSIWMKIFEGDIEMRQRFINAFPGTARDCFDSNTLPVTPRPANGLAHAGKI